MSNRSAIARKVDYGQTEACVYKTTASDGKACRRRRQINRVRCDGGNESACWVTTKCSSDRGIRCETQHAQTRAVASAAAPTGERIARCRSRRQRDRCARRISCAAGRSTVDSSRSAGHSAIADSTYRKSYIGRGTSLVGICRITLAVESPQTVAIGCSTGQRRIVIGCGITS